MSPQWYTSASGSFFARGTGTFLFHVQVHNVDDAPFTIVRAGRSGAGLDLLSVVPALPVTVNPGVTQPLVFTYRVTDCHAVTSDPWPIPITAKALWRELTVEYAPEQQQIDAELFFSKYGDTPASERPSFPPLPPGLTHVQWQRFYADKVCAMLDP